MDQIEEVALLQGSVQASPGSPAVSGKIPWSHHQAATVLSGAKDHSGNKFLIHLENPGPTY